MKICAAILFATLISAPCNVLDYPHDYPTFPDADKQGWSCSYRKENGVIVQYGDSQTPQQQWLALYGDHDVQ